MNLTIKELAALFDVTLQDERVITNIEFDSRLCDTDGLFVPLAGARDGHEFAGKAQENGAIAALWSNQAIETPAGLVVIPVEDTLQAFQKIAVYYQEKVQPKVVAITGSNGKTTTKDMTDAVLKQKYQTYKTQGNYNNEIGVPYTILHMPETTEILILEMGMDHFHEIEALSQLAQPQAAAITMVGEAHIENLGSREGIARAKMEIVHGLKEDGLLLVPADEPLLLPLTAKLTQQVVTFGLGIGNLSGTILRESAAETVFEVDGHVYRIPVIGGYNVKNALIALGFGHYYGLTPDDMAQGLAEFELTKNRTEWLEAGNGAAILSDVYNANPTAMRLVLESFAKIPVNGRKIAVLADMLELGPDSKKMHTEMAAALTEAYDLVFLYGEEMKALWEALAQKNLTLTVYHFDKEDKEQLIRAVQGILAPEDHLVLKGSNGMGLQEVVAALQSMKTN